MHPAMEVDYSQILKELGVEKGRTVLCHSAMPSMGFVKAPQKILVKAAESVLGSSGSFITPTFTYSAFNSEIFDPLSTVSKVGILGDFISSVGVRNSEPNFSHSGFGQSVFDILNWESKTPFLGKDGFYSRLEEEDALILLFGVDFDSLPVFMHCEVLSQVPYRKRKLFSGKVKTLNGILDVICTHDVRDDNRIPNTDRTRMGTYLKSVKDYREIKIRNGSIRCIPIKTVINCTNKKIESNPNYLLNEFNPFIESRKS